MRLWRQVVMFAVVAVVISGLYLTWSQNGAWVQRYWSIWVPVSFQRLASGAWSPCARPLTYRLGTVDKRFGMSEAATLQVIDHAVRIWEDSLSQDFFTYSPQGGLVINFVYDERQAATDRLKQYGITIDTTKESYDALRQKYLAVKAVVSREQKAYTSAENAYETKRQAYEAEVEFWNDRGGAPPSEYARLQQEQQELNRLTTKLKEQGRALEQQVADLNALVGVLNRIATQLNLDVSQYNKVATDRAKEFEEGIYESTVAGTAITIYEFDNQTQLVRLVAHELGHALGLGHLNNPTDIMYYLNQAKTLQLTANDIAAIKEKCALP